MAYTKLGYQDENGWNVLRINGGGTINVLGSFVATNLTSGSILNTQINVKDGNTGSLMDVKNAGNVSTYLGAQLVTGTAEVGSVHVTNMDTVILDESNSVIGSVIVKSGIVTTVSTVTNLTAGSVQLQSGIATIGSVHVASHPVITGSVYNNGGTVATVASLTAGSVQLQTSTNAIGSVVVSSVIGALPSGVNTLGSVYTIPHATGSVYSFEGTIVAGTTWLDAINPVIDYSIASVATGSVIIFART